MISSRAMVTVCAVALSRSASSPCMVIANALIAGPTSNRAARIDDHPTHTSVAAHQGVVWAG